MRVKQIKFFVIAAAVLILAAVTFSASWTRILPVNADDTAAMYKAKCAACHSPKAEKFFDPANTDEVLIEAILKGMKAPKPPNMPSFEKTVTPEQAKNLAAYMRKLRAPVVTNGSINANVKTNANVNVSVNTNINANSKVIVNAMVNSNAVTNVNTNTNAARNVNTTTANVNANMNVNANANLAANVTANENPKLAAEIAQLYKTKCAACHSPKAEKFFNSVKPDEQLVEIVLKGKKGAKPPFMPAFDAKGVSAEQAKELIKYMKKLH